MVAKNEIWTPESETNFGEEFRQELIGMMKKVALENKCNVEELKFSVNNTGMVNIQRMTPDEMIDRESKRIIKKQVKAIRKARNAG